jgi:hypothetical protein
MANNPPISPIHVPGPAFATDLQSILGITGHDTFRFGRFRFGGPTDSHAANPDLIKDFTPG